MMSKVLFLSALAFCRGEALTDASALSSAHVNTGANANAEATSNVHVNAENSSNVHTNGAASSNVQATAGASSDVHASTAASSFTNLFADSTADTSRPHGRHFGSSQGSSSSSDSTADTSRPQGRGHGHGRREPFGGEALAAKEAWDPEEPMGTKTDNRRNIDGISTVRSYHNNGRNPLACSDVEWTARTEAAALHRLIAVHGMSQDLEASQCVVQRIPETEEFLMGEWGLFFEEQTASQLLKYDLSGSIVHANGKKEDARSDRSNMGCLLVAITLLKFRPDFDVILHVHPSSVMAVGGLRIPMLPLSQASWFLYGQISKDHFDFFNEDSFSDALTRGFSAGKRAMFLEAHGLFAVGRDAAEAFYVAKSIDHACDIQVANLAMVKNYKEVIVPGTENLVRQSKDMVVARDHAFDGTREWPALVRQVSTVHPDYNI